MGRYSMLPDPFVAELRSIPGFLELTTGYTLCPECERCERSVVYLMGIVTHAEGDAAAQVAAKTSGVQRVVKVFEYSN